MRKAVPAVVVFLLLTFMTGSTPTAGEFRMENGSFVIRYTAGDERIAAELEHESLRIRKRIIADIGVDFSGRTEIRLCPTIEAFREAQPRGTWIPLWAVGVAYPGENLIVLRAPRAVKGSRIDVLDVFAHEFSHIALGRALAGVRVPVWLNEGLAIYEAREWTFSRISVLTRASLMDRLIPLPVLTLSFPAEEGPAELAYAESFMFVSFLINKVGREAFHRLIRDYTRYGDLEGALRRGTGMTLADLEERWLVYLKLRVSWIPIITSVSALWFIAALIFIYGYMRKKRQTKRRLIEMGQEEASEGWPPNG
ncbi:MAG: peptidase MA family metallohydrolase [Deltaproteobacteria bacterium]|nr:peptidase MA family metallohydrolase [Deltaproteobacteria bacterium]